MTTQITPYTTTPSRTNPSTFSADRDIRLAEEASRIAEMNAMAVEMNAEAVVCAEALVAAVAVAATANVTKWVSGTNYTEGDNTWSPTDFQTYRRKTDGAGTTDPSADTANWVKIVLNAVVLSTRTSNTILAAADRSVLVDITSGTFTQTFTAAATLGSGWFCYYRNSGTGVVTLDPNSGEHIDGVDTRIMYPGECRLIQCDGSGFYTILFWDATEHEVIVHTANGYGSTNNKIRRYTTQLVNTGTAITYADSAANGASFTINAAGVYAMQATDYRTSAYQCTAGISINSNQLTTAITTITAGNRIGVSVTENASSGGAWATVSAIRRLSVNDVIRPHDLGANTNSDVCTSFAIRKVST